MTVSIIIPVYNSDKSLETAVKSVLDQTFSDFELLLIDDGSNDDSWVICKKYQEIDSRVKAFHKENGGVSSARNYGIQMSQGEYLMFVDADDRIAPQMLQIMLGKANKCKSDMVFCGFEVIGSNLIKNDTGLLKQFERKNDCLEKNLIISSIITVSIDRLFGYVWRTLFKAGIISDNNIRFDENTKISEDFLFLVQAVGASDTFSVVPDELYYYCINPSSATAKYMPSLHQDMNYVNKWVINNIYDGRGKMPDGLITCQANTYLRAVQNLCRTGNPYTLMQRIKNAYLIKKQYGYEKILIHSLFTKEHVSKKNRISYLMLVLYFDCVYIWLFSIKCRRKQTHENRTNKERDA